jgi:uncharacterized OB-fold protein
VGTRLPLVNYLSIDGAGALAGVRCADCGARFLDAGRPACAACGGQSFTEQTFARTGSLRTFTIVHRGAPGVPVPFVSAVVDLDDGGPSVRANLLGLPPDPADIPRELRVELELLEVGTDDTGAIAVGFGFRPIVETEESKA